MRRILAVTLAVGLLASPAVADDLRFANDWAHLYSKGPKSQKFASGYLVGWNHALKSLGVLCYDIEYSKPFAALIYKRIRSSRRYQRMTLSEALREIGEEHHPCQTKSVKREWGEGMTTGSVSTFRNLRDR